MSLTLNAETQKNAALVAENIALIVQKTGANPIALLDMVKAQGTNVYRKPFSDRVLNLIGEEEGFIPALEGLDALILNLFVGSSFSFKSNPMFLMREGDIDGYYFLHHFYKWYAMKYRLPGFDYRSWKLLKISLKTPNDPRLKNLTLDEMLGLKEAIARDNEASDFVIKLAQRKDGSKKVITKMQDGGANI